MLPRALKPNLVPNSPSGTFPVACPAEVPWLFKGKPKSQKEGDEILGRTPGTVEERNKDNSQPTAAASVART